MDQWYSRENDARDCQNIQGDGKCSENSSEGLSEYSPGGTGGAERWLSGTLKASPVTLMFSRKLYFIFSIMVASWKDECQVDSLDPDSVQVMARNLMDAQERRRERVLKLVGKTRARMRGVETKGVLPDFAVGDCVLVARVKQAGITWTGPWRVVSKRGRHVYGMEDIVTGRSCKVHIARMRAYGDALLNVTAELKEVFNNLNSRGEFDMERIEAVDLAVDSEQDAVKVKRVGLDEDKITWEPMSTIYVDAPKYVVVQLRKLRLTKAVLHDLKKSMA